MGGVNERCEWEVLVALGGRLVAGGEVLIALQNGCEWEV